MGGLKTSTLILAAAGILLFFAGVLGAYGDALGYGLLDFRKR